MLVWHLKISSIIAYTNQSMIFNYEALPRSSGYFVSKYFSILFFTFCRNVLPIFNR